MKKPLNILVINTDWRDIFGTSFQELSDKLERDQLRPDFNNFFFFSWSTVSYSKKRDERFSSVHVKTMWRSFKPFMDLFSIVTIPLVVRKSGFKPDVIFIYDLGFVVPAKILKWMYGATIVLCMTNMPEVYSRTRRFGWIKGLYSSLLERLFARRVDVGYTINATMKEYLACTGLPENKIKVFASDTIFRDRKHIEQAQAGKVREKYGIRDDQKIILSVGRLEAEKDHPRLLEIFSKLDKSFVLIILGRGSLLEELQELARTLGIADRVIFTGFVHREEIWDYYQDADLFILLSTAEALGLVFWEAMYVGVPVVGSQAPGIVETVGKDGERGRLVEDSEPFESIKQKIDFCLNESEARNAMTVRAKEYVLEQLANKLTINDVI